jgi:hypothetical protein
LRNLHTHEQESQNKVKKFPWKFKARLPDKGLTNHEEEKHKRGELNRRRTRLAISTTINNVDI